MHKTIKYILTLSILFICTEAFSQKYKKSQNLPRYDFQKIHFGFTLGINELNFNLLKNYNDEKLQTVHTKGQKGFNLGIVSNLTGIPMHR